MEAASGALSELRLEKGVKGWDPVKVPSRSSLKSTPIATPEGSLRGGSLYTTRAADGGAADANGGMAANGVSTSSTSSGLSFAPSGGSGSGSGRVGWTELNNALNAKLLSKSTMLDKQHVAEEVDDRDVKTPDNWIPRHPDLVRLTGKHPFNCEAPLSMLVDQGFITPPSLHFVRNHGAAPQLSFDDHRLEVRGLVDTPLTLSMEDILAMPSVTIPVTLTCAGNRRKEQNMTKQTIGFSWGAAATSCNFWTGVRLRDVLEKAGIQMDKARHVCFVGCDDLPGGKYGTSIDLATAMDQFGEVMLAYEQNGIRLTPDHGAPLRVVIPGWIGGRMVKWLTGVSVTAEESQEHYHFFDNRIMPPHVDAELAKSEGWWYKREYLFNQLNINSAISSPANGELMSLSGAGVYTLKGYAYSGGGRKVTRVEVSVDGGKTWLLATLDHPEERHSHAPSYGRYYCWCFWEYTIDKFALLNAATSSGELLVRAWDEGNNTQPAKLTWNLMGMGNNCYFRVTVAPKQSSGEFALEFLHPTVPGPAEGGWMPPPQESVVAAAAAAVVAETLKRAKSAPQINKMDQEDTKTYTMEEVAKHDTEEDSWIVVHNKVYDCTPFLKDHPGGGASIVMNAGADCTEEFDAIHSTKAKGMLDDYYIGELAIEDIEDEPEQPALHMSKSSVQLMKDDFKEQSVRKAVADEEAAPVAPVALNPKKWVHFPLIQKEELSHDTRRFRFGLPTEGHRLGLPVGFHMFLAATIEGSMVMRAYTPTSSDAQLGYFDLVIKVYFANVHPKFPDGGKLTQFMEEMSIGDEIRVKGPLGHIEYRGRGEMTIDGKPRTVSALTGLMAGSGITPFYQILQAVMADPEDKTELYLIYANQTPEDVLLRSELDKMAAERDNIHVWYTCDRAPEDWQFDIGFMTEKMIKEHGAPSGPDVLGLSCGPPPFIKFAATPSLTKNGYAEENQFLF